jgi:hypothetical protein
LKNLEVNTMKKFAAVAVIPLFAGFLGAQQRETTETTTTKTTWNGTLIDAGCRATHTENKETAVTDQAGNTTTTKTETKTIECPVTTTTTSFGLLTPEGRYVRFDDPSNTQIVEVVKRNKKWNTYITERKPLRVRVVGRPDGDVVVMESIQ